MMTQASWRKKYTICMQNLYDDPMKKVIITFLLFFGIVASSCTTSKSVVSQNDDLSNYV